MGLHGKLWAVLPGIDCHSQHRGIKDSDQDDSDKPHTNRWIAKPRLQAAVMDQRPSFLTRAAAALVHACAWGSACE